jgi:nucleoside-diphosphate-sugar epimerase
MAAFRRVNADGTEGLARAAARRGVRRVVLVSTVGVLGRSTREDAPFTESSPPAPRGAYAVSKREGEERLCAALAGTGTEWTVVRPPLVYGPGAPGNFGRLAGWVMSGRPLPLASVRNRRSFVYVDNLCDALAFAAADPRAAGRCFLVSDGDVLSTPALVRRMAAALGRPARLFPVPPALLRAGLHLAGRGALAERLMDSLVVDDAALRALGWRPPVAPEEAMGRTLRAWREAA